MKTRKSDIITAILAICIMSFGVVACKTVTLPDNPTAVQVQEAACADAMDGILIATVALGVADLSAEKREYWNKYLGAAMTIRDAKCGGTK